MNIISPFEGVTLEVGGAVETYWKSITFAMPRIQPHLAYRMPISSRAMDSTHTSPSMQSTVASTTISSLQDAYIYITVQVTRDLHPVIHSDWLLPESGFDLGVADVTLAQFEALAARLGRNVLMDGPLDWCHIAAGSMISLAHLMTVCALRAGFSTLLTFVIPQVLPTTFGICIELAYPSEPISTPRSLIHQLGLNTCVDAMLRAIYHTSAALGGAFARRRIVFTSFSPDVCATINWKQPNCRSHPTACLCQR